MSEISLKERMLIEAGFIPKSRDDGGPGSGNFGHKGRPGKVGGSGQGGSGGPAGAKESRKEPGNTEGKNKYSISAHSGTPKEQMQKTLIGLGHSQEDIDKMRELFSNHSCSTREIQKVADEEIMRHIRDKDSIGKLLEDKALVEEQAWEEKKASEKKRLEKDYQEQLLYAEEQIKPGGLFENYSKKDLQDMGYWPEKEEYREPRLVRVGTMDRDTLSFSLNPEGASSFQVEYADPGTVHEYTMPELADMGYRPIGGIASFDVGASGESEVFFVKFPTKSQKKDGADTDNPSVKGDGGPGSGNFGHEGRPGEIGGSSPKGSGGVSSEKWRQSVSDQKAKLLSMDDAEQALTMWKKGVLSQDDAIDQMNNGTIRKTVEHYFDIMEANGDPAPTKATVNKQRHIGELVSSEYGGDWSAARVGEIAKDAGISKAEAEKVERELAVWTSSSWKKADTSVIDGYIEKAPAYAGEIHRGLSFGSQSDYDSFMEQVNSGVIRMNGNSSWSSDKGVARRFAHAGDDEVSSVIVRCVANRTATPIEHLASSSGGEDEVIAHSKASWSVLSVQEYKTPYGAKKSVVTVVERGAYTDE